MAAQTITPFHAKYFAYDLTRQAPPGAADQLSMSLFDAAVDLNPHQIEAAMFALQSPLSEGVILATKSNSGKPLKQALSFASAGPSANGACSLSALLRSGSSGRLS